MNFSLNLPEGDGLRAGTEAAGKASVVSAGSMMAGMFERGSALGRASGEATGAFPAITGLVFALSSGDE